jgi:SCY1-like protein 2
MPATAMFSKFKHGVTTGQTSLDSNPIVQYFEIGKQTASAGPELVWRIHDAYRKSDGKVRLGAIGGPSNLLRASLRTWACSAVALGTRQPFCRRSRSGRSG